MRPLLTLLIISLASWVWAIEVRIEESTHDARTLDRLHESLAVTQNPAVGKRIAASILAIWVHDLAPASPAEMSSFFTFLSTRQYEKALAEIRKILDQYPGWDLAYAMEYMAVFADGQYTKDEFNTMLNALRICVKLNPRNYDCMRYHLWLVTVSWDLEFTNQETDKLFQECDRLIEKLRKLYPSVLIGGQTLDQAKKLFQLSRPAERKHVL